MKAVFIHVGGVFQSSIILRWTVLKNVLYRFVCEAGFRYTVMQFTEFCFILVCGWKQFSSNLLWTVLNSVLYSLVGRSSLQVHCGALY